MRKEWINMTREKAIAASRAVDAIDSFQMFMEEVDKLMDESDIYTIDSAFRNKFTEMMETELARLNKVLAGL
jgi:hypothetical protein